MHHQQQHQPLPLGIVPSMSGGLASVAVVQQQHQQQIPHPHHVNNNVILPGRVGGVESLYAVPQRLEYKSDLKAALVEKYAEPQYQNVPNDYLLRRKSSVDANTMTNWQQNGLPDLEDRASRNLTKFNTETNTTQMSTSSITHSNSELNMCPHNTTTTTSKGSTKSKILDVFALLHTRGIMVDNF